MADSEQVAQQPSVSYLTNPAYNPTIVIHHHHGAALNVILMAATGTLVVVLLLFLAGVALYILRRRRRLRRKKAEKASDTSSSASQLDMTRSMFDSERDMDSFRHSKATCDTCSTRTRTTRPPLSYSPTPQGLSRLPRSSPYPINQSPRQTIEDQSNHHRLSVRVQQQQTHLHTPKLDSALAERFEIKSCEYKGKFDWDRCDFELQEEEAMWLPNRSQSFLKSRQLLARDSSLAHNRSCSESATLSPPPRPLVLPTLSKSRSRVTWTDSPLSFEAQNDYFESQQTPASSFTDMSLGLSPGQSTPKTFAGSGDYSPLMPASPYVVHTAPRHSYSVRIGTGDWEDAVESLDPESSHRPHTSPRSPCASINSSMSDLTAFSDPFGGSRTDLNSDFVVLSRPSPVRKKHSSPKLHIIDSPVNTRGSIRSATSPLISSPLKTKSESASALDSFCEPLADQILNGRRSEHFGRDQQSHGQRRRSATVGLGEAFPMETPLKTHRFDRRGAVVAANIPVSPTVTDYGVLK